MMKIQPALLAAVLVQAACSSPDEPPEYGSRAWVGEHLEIWTTPDAVACGGSFQMLDRHAGNLKATAVDLGVESRAEPFRYYWLDADLWERQSVCAPRAFGCVPSNGDAYANDALIMHELVHSITPRKSHTVLEEGVADVFGDQPTIDRWHIEPGKESLPELFDEFSGESLSGDFYPTVAVFSRLLLDLYPEEGWAAADSTGRGMDQTKIRSRLAQSGVDLDHVVSIYDDTEPCLIDSTRIAITECSTPPLPWKDETVWEAAAPLDCGSPDTYGPTRGDIWTYRRFDIVQSARYRVSIAAARGTWGRLLACDRDLCEGAAENFSGASHLLLDGSLLEVDLRPGRYWLRLDRPFEEGPDPDITLRVERL